MKRHWPSRRCLYLRVDIVRISDLCTYRRITNLEFATGEQIQIVAVPVSRDCAILPTHISGQGFEAPQPPRPKHLDVGQFDQLEFLGTHQSGRRSTFSDFPSVHKITNGLIAESQNSWFGEHLSDIIGR